MVWKIDGRAKGVVGDPDYILASSAGTPRQVELTSLDVMKIGDPVYNLRGDHVADVTSINQHCFGMTKREGVEGFSGPMQVESVLPDGRKAIIRVPDAGVATKIELTEQD
jgi:hypothetical protein